MIALIPLWKIFPGILQIFTKVSFIKYLNWHWELSFFFLNLSSDASLDNLNSRNRPVFDGPKVEQPVYLIMEHPDSVSELLADSRPA